MNQWNRKKTEMLFVLIFLVTMAVPQKLNAAVESMTSPGVACESGRYIYYAYEMSGIRMNLMRYDTKTGKKKTIVKYKKHGRRTNGFSDISIKGKYIYATWDCFYGSGGSANYIYRFNKNTGTAKKLATGSCPIIAGNYIYYIQEGTKKSYGKETKVTGKIYRMKLDGSAKKKVATVSKKIERLYKQGKKIFYSTWDSEEDVLYTIKNKETSKWDYPMHEDIKSDTYMEACIGNMVYSIGNSGKTLYRENVISDRSNNIITMSNGIESFRVCGKYLLVKGYNASYRYVVYCCSVDGKEKVKLASWMPGE